MNKFAFRLSRKHFAMPYIVFLTLFVIIPIALLLVRAFIDDTTGSFTLGNFTKFFTLKSGWMSLLRSLLVALISTIVCLLIGYPVAYILSNPKYNKSAVMVYLFVLPMWINFLLRILALKFLVFNILKMNSGYTTIIIGMVYDFLPFMILPIYNTLTNIDRSYIEASEDLGAKPFQVMFKTVLPLSVPGVISGVLMVFMPTISAFAVSDLMSNYNLSLFGTSIYFLTTTGRQINLGSAYSVILLAIISLTIIASRKFSKGAPAGGTLW